VGNPLNPIYEAVAWVFTHIYNVLSPLFGAQSGWTWALTIIILVVLMRLIMVPLFVKQMHTTRKMSALAPQMQALRKKYKNDKQTLNQEMMKLYQEAGVNPLMGCLPVVAQLPLFFALFSVLRAIAEWQSVAVSGQPRYGLPLSMVENAKDASIFGANITEKVLFTHGAVVPLHAKLVILGAVVISMITTFLTVRQSMKRGMMPAANPDNPLGNSQKYMMYIMPVFALSGLYWPFGLVLYWVTTNVWTLGQQWVLFRRYPQPAAATADAGASGSSSARQRPAVSGPTSTGGRGKPSGQGSKPSSQEGSGRRPSAGSAKPGPAKPGAAANGAVPAGGKNGRRPGVPASPGGPGNGQQAGGGVMRRLARGGRAEPEPVPEEPETKLVRQQPQRQSRSKRSGKR
jgi:YidC/Oxa1 family membrane protein insertase